MGLADEIGLVVRRPNAFQRLQQRIAATRPVARLYARTLDPIDSALSASTGGRITVPGLMAGLPIVFLTTTGARTGRARRTPLVGFPYEDGIGVIGTNYGRRSTPGWVVNLEADPGAELSFGDARVPVRADPVAESGLERLLEAGSAVYPGYRAYRSRIRGRRLRGFVLRRRDA